MTCLGNILHMWENMKSINVMDMCQGEIVPYLQVQVISRLLGQKTPERALVLEDFEQCWMT